MGAEEPPRGQGRKVGVRFPASPSSPGPPHPAPPLLRGGSQRSPGRGRRQRGPSPCSAPPKDRGRGEEGVAGAPNGGSRGGGSGSSVSKVSCPREAKDCGGGGGGGGRQRACVSSRPCSLLSAALPSSAAPRRAARSLLLLPQAVSPARSLPPLGARPAPAASLRSARQCGCVRGAGPLQRVTLV